MTKPNMMKRDEVENIAYMVWKCIDFMRSNVMNRHIQIILFFTSLYKDGLISKIKSVDFNLDNEIEEFYSKIFDIYKPIIDKISSEELDEIGFCLKQIDKQRLNENFEDVFEYILKKIVDFQGKDSGESIQPRELTRFIISIANLKEGSKVFNPFGGFASFGTILNGDQEYLGQEINDSTWAIAQLRLRAHKKENRYSFELKNSILNWNEEKRFDLIVANPPIKLRVPKSLKSEIFNDSYSSVENFLVEKGIHSLNNNGKLITVFSLSFLFSGGREANFRKWLISNGLIDTIITLPSGLLSNTNVPVCIIIFKTIRTRPGYVKFIDASTFYHINGPKYKVLNDQYLLALIDRDEENEFLRYISTEDIVKNNYNLSVGRYFLGEIDGTKLKNFSTRIKGSKVDINQNFKTVQIRDLKDDVFDCVLKSDVLDKNFIQRTNFRLIEESCVLIATRWNTLKPTYFKYTGEPIAVSEAIEALKIQEEVMNPIFLINEFSADYVQNQIKSYRVGSVQPILRQSDLARVVFQIPSIEEQEAKVSGIIELAERLKKLEREKEKLISGKKEEETESSTSLSHVLGKPLLSIGSSLEIIQGVLYKLSSDWKETLISQKKQYTLADAFDSISKNVKYIQELADRNTSMISISNFDLQEIQFLRFLAEFAKNEKKALAENINLDLDVHKDIKQQMDNQVLIKGNPQKLRIALINLIDNAKNHAFLDDRSLNKIHIEIAPFTRNEREASILNYDIDGRKSYVEVKVSNTGAPFPKEFTLKDYVRKNFGAGDKSNRGLGGYEVNEILKAHNEGRPALNLVSNKEDSEYITTISFIIPII